MVRRDGIQATAFPRLALQPGRWALYAEVPARMVTAYGVCCLVEVVEEEGIEACLDGVDGIVTRAIDDWAANGRLGPVLGDTLVPIVREEVAPGLVPRIDALRLSSRCRDVHLDIRYEPCHVSVTVGIGCQMSTVSLASTIWSLDTVVARMVWPSALSSETRTR